MMTKVSEQHMVLVFIFQLLSFANHIYFLPPGNIIFDFTDNSVSKSHFGKQSNELKTSLFQAPTSTVYLQEYFKTWGTDVYTEKK